MSFDQITQGLLPEALSDLVPPGKQLVGIDEVGRGAWAGPLLMAAVVLGEVGPLGITDSKLMTPARRRHAARQIKQTARAIGFGWVPAIELDQVGLAKALRLAAKRALAQVDRYDHIIIDGNVNFLPDEPARALPKADFLIPAVAAASIVAKVARDHYMHRLALQHPEYGFERHVGYGTAAHIHALRLHGPSPHHRHSFRPVRELAS